MDHDSLLNIAMKLGYRLAMSGAETYRVEESIVRIMAAYGINAEAFAIPNLLIINIETPDGQVQTRMRRIGYHGNDLDSVERYNSISRKICTEAPSADEALKWLREADKARRTYNLPLYLAGHFLGACGFAVFFGGSFVDSMCAGICGIIVGLVNRFMNTLKVNSFFSTITSAYFAAIAAYFLGAVSIARQTDTVIIGTLMILVPGLLFTNAMRDIIFGDTNSGVNRIVQVLLVAVAIALGTGAAWNIANSIWESSADFTPLTFPYWLQCVASFIGCVGFAIVFNIHGPGVLLCALGGFLAWATYCLSHHFTGNEILSYFLAAIISSIYSEAMARIRKCPAIAYLVVSIFPLLPGAGIYYTTSAIVRGDMVSFASKGTNTIAIAGILAVGVLMVSTIVRLWGVWKQSNKKASV